MRPPSPATADQFERVGALLQRAQRVLFITGACVSAESGIPTFRGATAAFADGLTEEGLAFEEVLSIETLQRNPLLSQKYLFKLEQSIRGREPNAAHRAMAAFQTPKRDVFVTTQNIDELHQRAGSWNVFELHGNLRRIIFKRYKNTKYLETFESLAKLPRCPDCQAILRPEVVLYGEALPGGVPGAFHRQQVQGFDVVFTVGTTSLFQYVIEPMLAAVRQGVPVVEINPDITPVFELAGFRFAGPAGETLAKLAATLAV